MRKVAVKFSLTFPIAHNNLLHANIENKTACNTLAVRTLLQAVFLFVFSYLNLCEFIICIFGNHVSVGGVQRYYVSVSVIPVYRRYSVHFPCYKVSAVYVSCLFGSVSVKLKYHSVSVIHIVYRNSVLCSAYVVPGSVIGVFDYCISLIDSGKTVKDVLCICTMFHL